MFSQTNNILSRVNFICQFRNTFFLVSKNCFQQWNDYFQEWNCIFHKLKWFGNISDPCDPSQGSHHRQTQLQDGSRLTFSYTSIPSFTFPGALYRIFLLFLPCHVYLVDIEQQHRPRQWLNNGHSVCVSVGCGKVVRVPWSDPNLVL